MNRQHRRLPQTTKTDNNIAYHKLAIVVAYHRPAITVAYHRLAIAVAYHQEQSYATQKISLSLAPPFDLEPLPLSSTSNDDAAEDFRLQIWLRIRRFRLQTPSFGGLEFSSPLRSSPLANLRFRSDFDSSSNGISPSCVGTEQWMLVHSGGSENKLLSFEYLTFDSHSPFS
nr:hypothetical protein Iba_scaffold392146CG0010 [Ipomoea batatas]